MASPFWQCGIYATAYLHSGPLEHRQPLWNCTFAVTRDHIILRNSISWFTYIIHFIVFENELT